MGSPVATWRVSPEKGSTQWTCEQKSKKARAVCCRLEENIARVAATLTTARTAMNVEAASCQSIRDHILSSELLFTSVGGSECMYRCEQCAGYNRWAGAISPILSLPVVSRNILGFNAQKASELCSPQKVNQKGLEPSATEATRRDQNDRSTPSQPKAESPTARTSLCADSERNSHQAFFSLKQIIAGQTGVRV